MLSPVRTRTGLTLGAPPWELSQCWAPSRPHPDRQGPEGGVHLGTALRVGGHSGARGAGRQGKWAGLPEGWELPSCSPLHPGASTALGTQHNGYPLRPCSQAPHR